MFDPMKKLRTRSSRSGFTIIEVLTAFFVIGIATTIFVRLYSSSLSLGRTSTHYAVASQIAEEYMAELQVNPGQFAWPNFADSPVGDLIEVKVIDDESAIKYVEPPTAMPSVQGAHDRQSQLYRDFEWIAYARIHEESSNFVEVMVEISWKNKGKFQRFYLTSAVPRSIGEGIGG